MAILVSEPEKPANMKKCRAGATPNYNSFGTAVARRMNWALDATSRLLNFTSMNKPYSTDLESKY